MIDSYLRKTFSRVYEHTQPDVIIFLGDIMDEGSKATDLEYESYFNRFNNIFYEKKHTKVCSTVVCSWLLVNYYTFTIKHNRQVVINIDNLIMIVVFHEWMFKALGFYLGIRKYGWRLLFDKNVSVYVFWLLDLQ